MRKLTGSQIKRIIYLRRHGNSVPGIRRITGYGCGTILKYIQNVKILPEFEGVWRDKQKTSVMRASRQLQEAQKQAKNLLKKIGKKEKIIIATCLYWAEGAKRDFSFSNTDPDLIKTFIESLKEFGIRKENLSISLRIYEDLDKARVCKFWSGITGVPKEKIKYIDILSGRKQGKLKYGLCRVRVIKGGYFLKLLYALQEIIKNNINKRPCSSTGQNSSLLKNK